MTSTPPRPLPTKARARWAASISLSALLLSAFVATDAAQAAGRNGRARPRVSVAKRLAFRQALRLDGRPTIVLATDNVTKAKEYRRALIHGSQGLGRELRVLSIEDLLHAARTLKGRGVPSKVKTVLKLLEDIPEHSHTFAGNANAKARIVARVLRDFGVMLPVLADDSGLEIKSLGGWPGVYTKRALGDGDGRIQAILDAFGRAKDQSDRRIRQHTAIAVAMPSERITHVDLFHGVLNGTLLEKPQGTKHFPGERLFGISARSATKAGARPPARGRLSIGQLTIEQKTAIGSRGQALELALPTLRRLLSATK